MGFVKPFSDRVDVNTRTCNMNLIDLEKVIELSMKKLFGFSQFPANDET